MHHTYSKSPGYIPVKLEKKNSKTSGRGFWPVMGEIK